MKKKIFITGVTGTMGAATFKKLLEHKDKLDLVTLIRPSKKNKKIMAAYDDSHLEIIWGDLRNYSDVEKAVQDADYILHLAALVSPLADLYPEAAGVYNIGGGESCRINNYDFTSQMLEVLGIKDIKKVFDLNWYSTQNFHGQYYLDSDILNDFLDFRREGFEDF